MSKLSEPDEIVRQRLATQQAFYEASETFVLGMVILMIVVAAIIAHFSPRTPREEIKPETGSAIQIIR